MDFRRLFDLLTFQQSRYPQKIALAHQEQGKWKHFSTNEVIKLVDQVSAALIDMGLEKGDKAALLFESGNAYFNLLDFGMLQLGVISVPVHSNIRQEELIHVMKDSGAKICITSSLGLYEKVEDIRNQLLDLKSVFCLEAKTKVPGWEKLTIHPNNKHQAKIADMRSWIHEDDLATIIYTSGSSGMPKGVMLSHKNIVSNIKATITLVPINSSKRVISFLPLSHVFERMVTFSYIAAGASIYYVRKIDEVVGVLKAVRPHYFTSVPKLLERIYEDVLEQSESGAKLKRRIIKWALVLGERYKGKRQTGFGYWLKLKIADLLVYRYWRKVLGGKVEGVIVGAAALQQKLGQLFSAAGIEIREGYGLTETSPVIAFNRFEPGGVHFGTVGIPIPGVEVNINNANEEGEGEILIKGPGLMKGYHNLPELTAEVIDKDGWFHTGDVGKFVHKRFLQITDRKKDIFKTSSGKYVAPQAVERLLNASIYVEQSFVFGFNRPYVVALILPNFDRLEQWCERHNVHWTAPQFMAINPKVIKFMQEQIDTVNAQLSTTAKVKEFMLLHKPWTVANGEITPTLKLKRSFILKKYEKTIDQLYEA